VDISSLSFKAEDGLMLEANWKYEIKASTRLKITAYSYIINNYVQFDLIDY